MSRVPVSSPRLSQLEMELVYSCLVANQLTQGEKCQQFERDLAARLQTTYAVVTSSGTTALHLALAAHNIASGDEVIIPDLTFVATGNAVLYTGATPILVDVHPRTWCIDPMKISSRITDRTRAVVIVHLYGVSCDMERLYEVIPSNIPIIEDAAEGFGGVYCNGPHKGEPLGSRHTSAFSFYGNKVITTGEGGAVTTNSPTLAERLRLLRGQAMSVRQRYMHTEVGYNYRMTDVQAAIGIGQLSHLDSLLAARRAIIDTYHRGLGSDYPAPCTLAGSAPWLYTVMLDSPEDRTRVERALHLREVDTRPAFVPLHRMPMFAGDRVYPVASRVSDCALSLPTYPDLPLQTVDSICATVNGALE